MGLNNCSEPTDLELYFMEIQFSKSKYDFDLLQYLMNRDYKEEAVALLQNFIDLEGILVQMNIRYS